MSNSNEFEVQAVTPQQLQPGRYFAASYAGEHVAGTEFVIGALFVSWGVSTSDILLGLLLGNFLAVLTWALICAPIATQTRLTLYAYLEKIGGPNLVKIYSVVNGVLFCVLAGAMITVSASAVRILFGIEPQVNWYPSSLGFIAVALAVGAVVVVIAMRGFKGVAQFAQVCAPWMILMFIAGALATFPILADNTQGLSSLNSIDRFFKIADTHIWKNDGADIGIWHVAAFAWICNLAMHGSLSDMSLLRYARKSSYGYYSALGMFIGHYVAWICAGIMGAGAAVILSSSITSLDAGEVAFQALGSAGILAVIIAGWTTSNPTIYRAGLAFQSLNKKWSLTKVTAVVGVATTIIACFPFVFTKLLSFVGIMGLILTPVGAIIVTEHWIFPRIGFTRYWTTYSGRKMNFPAIITWGVSLLAGWYFESQLGLHLFFLLIPTWILTTVIYTLLAGRFGAKAHYPQAQPHEQELAERIESEKRYLAENRNHQESSKAWTTNRILSWLMLLICALMAVYLLVSGSGEFEWFKSWLILPTLAYFVFATTAVRKGG